MNVQALAGAVGPGAGDGDRRWPESVCKGDPEFTIDDLRIGIPGAAARDRGLQIRTQGVREITGDIERRRT